MLRPTCPLNRLGLGASLFFLAGCGGSSTYHRDNRPFDEASSVAIADLDADGRPDAVTALATYGGGAPHPGFVSRRYQDATRPGTFKDPIRQDAGSDPIALAAADLDGDGLPDLVVANTQMIPGPIAGNTLSLLLTGPSILTVMPPRSLALGNRDPLDLALGDLDGDGDVDIAVAARGGNNLMIFFQTGLAAFGSPVMVPLNAEPTCLAIADLNGDGRLDLAAGTGAGTLSVLLQSPALSGAFLAAVDYTLGSYPNQVRVADLDGDGRRDVALALEDAGRLGLLGILRQDPGQAGRFLPLKDYVTQDASACALAIGDLDGDGQPEIVVANYGAPGWPGSLTLFQSSEAGPAAFGIRAIYNGYYGPRSVAMGDLNGDGRPDLLIADGDPTIRFQDPAHPGAFLPPVGLRH